MKTSLINSVGGRCFVKIPAVALSKEAKANYPVAKNESKTVFSIVLAPVMRHFISRAILF